MIPLLLAAALIPPPAARLPPVKEPPAADSGAEPQSTPPTADAASQALLSRLGWKAIENDALVRLAGAQKGYIPGNYLAEAGLEWKDGDLNFEGGDAIPETLLPMILEGLWLFVQAARTPPAEAGKTLAAWGLPPVIDGRKLVDPDGSATYYGQMLRLIYAERPDALKRAGAERLSQALDLLLHAREQAFGTASDDAKKLQAPDIAKTDVDRARLVLSAPVRAGETAFGVTPYEDLGGQLAGFKRELETDVVAANAAGDAARAKDSVAALNVLNTLERQHYHPETALPAVPKPGAPPAETDEDAEDSPAEAPANAPLASGLPRLLKILDRVNGAPLTRAQQENLVKSFPMGDIVWRLGAQDLWRQGLTGKDVKVAVIDGGIGKHDELADAVKARTNFTAQRGKALADDHGTHVAGILHALAPDAEIRGYTVLTEDNSNPALMETADTPLLDAVDQAVKDGNLIISMSLGTAGGPSDSLARKVEQYAEKGVLFIVSAGNERGSNDIAAPSVAPNALTVGALDGAGRPADFSSYGANFDARKLKYVVKSVFVLPGVNVYSTVIGPDGESGYALMNGTSMATPALSGVAALLAQAAAAITANPVELSSRVRDALVEGSAPLSLDRLPPNAPFDQPFLVVQPLASLDALRRKAAPSAAGGPDRN